MAETQRGIDSHIISLVYHSIFMRDLKVLDSKEHVRKEPAVADLHPRKSSTVTYQLPSIASENSFQHFNFSEPNTRDGHTPSIEPDSQGCSSSIPTTPGNRADSDAQGL
jgi:hypothetical protein